MDAAAAELLSLATGPKIARQRWLSTGDFGNVELWRLAAGGGKH